MLALRAAKDNAVKKAHERALKRLLPYLLEDLEWEADQKLRGEERAEAQKALDSMRERLGAAET